MKKSGLFLVLTMVTITAESASLYVDLNSTNPVSPYATWETAATTIHDAVNVSTNGDIICVTNGTYAVSSEITVTNSITIQSVNGPEVTIVDGGGSNRCFNLGSTACTISGLTITNGYSSGDGGGVYCSSTTPVMTNCILSGNTAGSNGGGIYYGTANSCTISGNSANYGGGGRYSALNGCVISNNIATYGGGISDGSLNYCLVSGNSAASGGGVYGGNATDCVISLNSADNDGGGAHSTTLDRCRINGNTAENFGGGGVCFGVANNSAIFGNTSGGGMVHGTAHNCIITGNTGVGVLGGASVFNSIIWGNYPRDWAGFSLPMNSCSPDLTHGINGNITNHPLLVSTSHLAADSPCRGAGSSLYSSGTDIDGEVWLNPPSMGCDEYYDTGSVTGEMTVAIAGPTNTISAVSAEFAGGISGAVIRHVWNFGDGTLMTNNLWPEHVWNSKGIYDVVLTAYNDTYPLGISATQSVEVITMYDLAIYVAPGGNDANDGSSWATAKATLQAGVDAQSVEGGWVLVSNGTYVVTNEITVNKPVEIRSLNGPEVTIVDGGGSSRCFNLSNTVCTLNGLTITNGYSSDYGGGGVYCSSTTPVLTNCTIIANTAISGGGIYYGTAKNCTITQNGAGSGGGCRNAYLINCAVIDNVALSGGGLYDGTAVNCTVSGNSASRGGGAYGSEIYNSIVWGNLRAAEGINLYSVSVVMNCCSPDLEHGVNGNITNAPLLVSASHLSTNSPCIGAGSSAYASGTDIAGEAWLSPPSMGCGEFHGAGSVTGALQVAISCNPFVAVGMHSELTADIYGPATMQTWDFGDGVCVTNSPFLEYEWDTAGFYDVILTAYSETWPGGVSATQTVHVLSPDEKVFWEGSGHMYQPVLAPEGKTWLEAQADAASRGGYLATPVSDAENRFVSNLTYPTNYWHGGEGPCLGAFQSVGSPEPDGNWQWISGEPMSFNIWYPRQPNNMYGNQNRMRFFLLPYTMEDTFDSMLFYGYVVEYQIVEGASGSLSVAIGGNQAVVAGTPLEMAGTLEGVATGLEWNFGDGSSVTNNQFPLHTWTVPGDYDVTFTAFNLDHPGGVSATQTICVLSAEDSIVHVAPSGNDTNSGLTWASAKATLQGGVDATVDGGTLLVSNGTYLVTNEVVVNQDIIVHAVSGPEETIVVAGASNRCFTLIGNCILSGVTVTNGYAENGGGILCFGTTPIITNCLITGNRAILYGGGVEFGTVYNSVIRENNSDAYSGGAHWSILYNSLVDSNTAGRYAGGLRLCDAYNCTIVNNNGGSRGGGIYDCRAYNSIIYGNTAFSSGAEDIYVSNDDLAALENSCSPDAVPGVDGNITSNPLFVDFTNGNYRLQSNSPCINRGNNAVEIGSADLDGNPRVFEMYVDMGCYEYQETVGLDGDLNGNGFLDAWEWQYFSGSFDPDANADGDDQSNGDEYISGTDPTNSASYFHVTTGMTTTENPTQYMIINWDAVTGRVYNVYWTPSLTEKFQPLEIGIQYPQNSYTDTVHNAESSAYYRVVVMRADYDADGDGMPNEWESQYGVADAFADGDNDGLNNLAEFVAGTIPTNAASCFYAVNSVAEVNRTNCFVVEWISIPDRVYSVRWSPNLFSGFQTLEAGIEYPQNSYTDTVHGAESAGFYDVQVELK